MNYFYASIGTIIGSVYFILGDNRILIAAIVCLLLSSSIFTSLHSYKKEIISFLLAFIIVFFNFNLRSEHLEYLDPIVFDLSQKQYLEIVTHPQDKFFKSNFIIEIKSQKPDLKTRIREIFLPYRLLASAESSQGLNKGDLVSVDSLPLEIVKANKSQYYKSQKTFYKLKNQLNYTGHKANWIQRLQNGIQRFYYKHLDPINASITTSLLLGSRLSKMSNSITQQIRNLGIGHFFAASGFHLLMLSLALHWLFKLFNTTKLITSIAIISSSLIYTALADFSPSIIRAAILISVYLILDLIVRKPKSTKLLIYTAGLILLIDPHTIYDLGFQFSYLATLAILIWAKPIRSKLEFLPGYIADIVSVSLAVQILLVPVIIFYFDNLQPWTLIANIIFTPLLSALTLCSFAGLYFIIDPLLNLFRYLLEHSQTLPLMQVQINVKFETVALLWLCLNLVAYSLTQQEYKNIQANDFTGMIQNIWGSLISNNHTRNALIIGSIIIIIGFNAYPPYLKQINVRNGEIEHKAYTQFIESKLNHQYFQLNKLNVLAIKDRSSLDKLAQIDNLKEVNLLILPELNAKDVYLDTLIALTKPQFVIASVKHNSDKVKANLEIIGANANTIVNNGRLNIGHDKFWSIDSI